MVERSLTAPAPLVAEDHSKRINTDFWLLLISFGQYLEKGASAKDSFSDLWMVLIVEIKYFVLGQSADV